MGQYGQASAPAAKRYVGYQNRNMNVKSIMAIAGVAMSLLCFAGAIFSWIMAVLAGSRMNNYLKTNHSDKWNQLRSSFWTANTDHWFYIMDNNYENDPHFEPLKRNTRKWCSRFLIALGMFASFLFATFITMEVLKA